MKRTEKLSRKARYGILAAIMAGAFSIMPAAQAMPTGGASGTATITTTGSTMEIASSVTNNLLTWQDFSIASGETVNFGGSNTYLNVVTGSSASEIYGAITGSAANVYLINPNGILFGDEAQVNVGSLHLSTADITSSLTNFDTAMNALNGADSFSGDIVNKGTLKATQEITVDGNNITFKNTADVTSPQVTLQATGSGEIHIGSADASTPDYTMNGTKYMYKLVSTAGDLQNINNDPTANYMLADDIDASGIQKFTPIGMTAENGFTGKFDGLGYTIKGLQIDVRQLNGDSGDASNTQVLYNGAVSKVGLFSSLGAEAVVENVGLLDGSVSVTFGGDSTTANAYTVNAGSLAGVNAGTIRNVYSTNTVTVQTTERGMFYSREEGKDIKGYVGGLVGENQGTISKAYTTGAVTGSLSGEMLSVRRNAIALYVGGLAGTNSGGIAQAYHGTGTVSASLNARMDVSSYSDQSGIYAGGLVGSNAGALTNIYNTGAVSGSISSDMLIDMMEGSLHAGGIVGMQSSNGTLTSSYNTGAVSGSIKARDMIFMSGGSLLAGGIAGQAAGQITGAYNTGEVTTAAAANDMVNVGTNNHSDISGGGNGTLTNTGRLEAEQAKAATSYTGFNLTADGADKNAAWRIYEGTTMPLLTAFMKRKDTISSREYDGTANVGTNITAATLTSTQEEGINWVNEISLITPKNVTITFQNADKTYDGTTEVKTVNANLDGVLDSDKENVALSATGNYDSKNAGDHTITYSGIALTGTAAANYQLTGLAEGKGTGKGTITAAPLTITFADTNKQYDGTTNAVAGQGTLQGVLGNDQVSYEATAAYDSKNAGSRTVNYSGITLTGADAGNYSIEGAAEGKGTITAAPLTITFADTNKQYDGTTNAVAGQGTLNGVLGEDNVSYAADVTAVYDSKNAGSRTVNYSGITLTGADAGNYSIEAAAEGKGTITAAPLTITFADINKQYDGTTNTVAGQGTLNGVLGEDNVSYAADVTAVYDSKNAGSRTVNYSGITLTGADAGNYSIEAAAEGKGTITAAPLTITFADINKQYDGTTNTVAGQGTLNGVLGEDNVSYAADVTAVYDSKNAGSRTVNYSGITLTGADAGNYSIEAAAEGKGTITAAPLTITFADINKQYDGTTNTVAGQGTLNGVLGEDNVSYAADVTAVYDSKNAGSRTVNYSGITLTGADAGNYSIEAAAEGKGTITAAPLTITFADINKQYDGTTNTVAGQGTLNGVLGEDNVSYAADVTAVYDSKNAGSRTVNYSGITLTGADAGNYSIEAAAEGKGTITAAPLTLTVNDTSKEYDGTTAAPGAEYQVTAGRLFGDDTLQGGSFAYADAAAGTGKTVTLTGVTVNDGNDGKNYTINVVNSTNSTITPKAEPAPEPTPAPTPAERIQEGLDKAGVSGRELDEAVNSSRPNVQSHAASVQEDRLQENREMDRAREAGTETNGRISADLGSNGMLSIENQGINAPESMTGEAVAEQQQESKTNAQDKDNKEGE